MKLLYINNAGGGYADWIDVADGTTVEKLFTQKMPDASPSDYLIRVNRQPCSRDQVLHDGDRISVVPTKIEGARGHFRIRAAA